MQMSGLENNREAVEYIRDNFQIKNMAEIGEILGVHKSVIQRLSKKLGLKKKYVKKYHNVGIVKKITDRPPAKYDNMSREDYLTYWENYQIKSN